MFLSSMVSTKITLLFTLLCCACVGRTAVKDQTSKLADNQNAEKFNLTIAPSVAPQEINLEKVKQTIRASIDSFEVESGLPVEPLNISIGESGCLRTGYNFEKRIVQFCQNERTPAFGTASVDVIHHELFHALICQMKPQWCNAEVLKNPSLVALHEAMADLHAYKLNPDQNFGEGFYSDTPTVRPFSSTGCYNLLDNPYLMATALVTHVLSAPQTVLSLGKILKADQLSLDLFSVSSDNCFTSEGPAITVTAENYPASDLFRFRIRHDEPLRLRFTPNSEFTKKYRDFRVEWQLQEQIFKIDQLNQQESSLLFTFTALQKDGWTKVIANYWSRDRWLGSKAFYLSIRNSNL